MAHNVQTPAQIDLKSLKSTHTLLITLCRCTLDALNCFTLSLTTIVVLVLKLAANFTAVTDRVRLKLVLKVKGWDDFSRYNQSWQSLEEGCWKARSLDETIN